MASLEVIFVCLLIASASGQFSTRPSYEDVRGNNLTTQPGCVTTKIWGLITPGAHFPSADEISRFRRLENLRDRILDNVQTWNSGELSDEILDSLRTWSLDLEAGKAGGLGGNATQEIEAFAQRLRRAFPLVFSRGSQSQHLINPGGNRNAYETTEVFTSAIYNGNTNLDPVEDFTDFLDSHCPRWRLAKQEAERKADEWRNSSKMREVVTRVSNKLGFTRLNQDVVRDIYLVCSYERLLTPNNNSPWCSLLNNSDLEVFEYEEDILSYYTSGPGNPNIEKLGCHFVSFITMILKGLETKKTAIVHITNSLSLGATLSAMSAFKHEEPPTPDNFSTRGSRSWRNSVISPSLGNLVVALDSCGTNRERYDAVTMYLNEYPIRVEGCQGTTCRLSRFLQEYEHITHPRTCNTDYCS